MKLRTPAPGLGRRSTGIGYADVEASKMARGLANEPMHLFGYRHVNHPGYQLRSGFATDPLRGPEQH